MNREVSKIKKIINNRFNCKKCYVKRYCTYMNGDNSPISITRCEAEGFEYGFFCAIDLMAKEISNIRDSDTSEIAFQRLVDFINNIKEYE